MPVSRTFVESGGSATRGYEFWVATEAAATVDSTISRTGPTSLKFSTGSPAVRAGVTSPAILSDAGSTISFAYRMSRLPTATGNMFLFRTSGSVNIYFLQQLTNGKLNQAPVGATAKTGITVLTFDRWYQITLAYTITNTTTFRFDVYVDGVLDSSTTAGTLTNTGSDNFRFQIPTAWGANSSIWIDDVVCSNSSDYTDPGFIRVEAKRPNANGTAVQFTTQIGSGGSGYGTGHSPQVNEQPLSTTNGWSIVNAGSAATEEYNIESNITGDTSLVDVTIVDVVGWVDASTLLAETGQIVVDGVSSNISLTTTTTLFTLISGATTYPAGTGTDIGLVTSAAVTTVSLYECGVLIVFTYSIEPTLMASVIAQETASGLMVGQVWM